jgi:hypothetical protein
MKLKALSTKAVVYLWVWVVTGKMDILQLIYDLHDLISKYVEKIFGEGE